MTLTPAEHVAPSSATAAPPGHLGSAPPVERVTPLLCDRCSVEMTLRPMYEGSKRLGWYCPCCRSVLRTIELLEADAERDAAEMGLSREQYEAHMDARAKELFRQEPFTPSQLAHAQASVSKRAAEWKPVCEHETENPWT